MASPALLLLCTADAPRRDPTALATALDARLALPGAHWARNLLDEAVRRGLHPVVLERLLLQFRRFQRRQPGVAHDQEALVTAARLLPDSPQAELLLAGVALGPREEPELPLRVLLAAAQSRSERWALRVLRSPTSVATAVRSVDATAGLSGRATKPTALDFLVETAQEAVRSDMSALLLELLALNRPAVELAAVKWARRMDEIVSSAAAGRRLSASASHRLDTAAGKTARHLAATVEVRAVWQRVKCIMMERRRSGRPAESSEKQSNWLGLGGRRRHVRRRTEARQEVSSHPIVSLPDALFASVLTFLVASARE